MAKKVILPARRVLGGDKEGAGCSAQTTNLLQDGAALGEKRAGIMDRLDALKDLSDRRWMVCRLMAVGGLRVSEALRVGYADITVDGAVLVKGSKGSMSKRVFDEVLKSYLLKCKAARRDPWPYLSRFTIHRYVKDAGLSEQFRGKKKCSTTHVFRHRFVASMREIGSDEQSMAEAVGHKSIKSTSYYGKG